MRRVWPAVFAALVLAAVGSIAQATFGRTTHDRSRTARTLLKQWTAYVESGAKLNPKPHFAKARRTTIEQILERNAGRFGYTPRRVTVLPGRDGAPMIIVKVCGRPLGFSRSFPTLWRRLDPLSQAPGPDWHTYTYEAFFFEALDSHGIPFLVVWNAWRQPPRGGGQWARTEALLPFQHG